MSFAVHFLRLYDDLTRLCQGIGNVANDLTKNAVRSDLGLKGELERLKRCTLNISEAIDRVAEAAEVQLVEEQPAEGFRRVVITFLIERELVMTGNEIASAMRKAIDRTQFYQVCANNGAKIDDVLSIIPHP